MGTSERMKTQLPFFVDYNEDEIVERKLFFEGGSSLDDTAISKLTRMICKFCTEPEKLKVEVEKDGTTPIIPSLEAQFEELSKAIEQCRFTALKSQNVISACEREFDFFMEAIEKEEQAVKTSQRQVSKAVLDLEFEKKMLSIQGLPATGETQAKLSELEQRRQECQNNIEKRKKQFEVLADVAKRFEMLLQDETENTNQIDEKLKMKKETTPEDLGGLKSETHLG